MRGLRVLLLLSVGCTAGRLINGQPGSGPDAPPAIPVATLPVIAASPSTIATECFPLAGARPLAVDSEGEMWLWDGSMRVITPTGEASERTTVRPFDEIGPAAAIGGSLFFEAAGFLWRQRESETSLGQPHGDTSLVSLCGALDRPGAMLVQPDRLLQRTTDGWWQIEPGSGDDFGAMLFAASRDGACAGVDDRVWLGSNRGIWRGDGAASTLTRVAWPGGGPAEFAVTDSLGIVVAGEGAIYQRAPTGTDWSGLQLSGAGAVHVSAAGDDVWVVNDRTLYWHRGTWKQASLPQGGVEAIDAYAAGGAWLRRGDEVCHVAADAPIVVRGLSPFERRLSVSTNLTVESAGATQLVVLVDDESQAEVSASTLDQTDLPLGDAGWHRLSVNATGPAGVRTRHVDYYVEPGEVSFADDIAPLAAEHCSGCHQHRGQLLTFEEWRDNPQIPGFVASGNMPRSPNASWGPSQKALIRAWYEGGMRP